MSGIIWRKISTRSLLANANNNGTYSHHPEPYPAMVDSGDYEVQVHVNFVTRELRLLKLVGANDGADIFLFTREKCRPDCANDACANCRTRKLYQDKAGDPQGAVPYSPHQEYLYCLRFDRQPITALLALIPREQDVEVKEKGVLAYWFMKWFERSKLLNPGAAVPGIQRLQSVDLEGKGTQGSVPQTFGLLPAAAPPPPPQEQQQQQPQQQQQQRQQQNPQEPAEPMRQADAPAGLGDRKKDEEDEENSPPECSVMHRDENTSEDPLQKQTKSYLPNMQVIYQVKKDQMSVILPKPEQLTRPLDVFLVNVEKDGHGKKQAISLLPGAVQSSNSLVALRNTAYTLQVQLHDKGRAVDLLDFITENKILRVQESKDAPKQLNFLMERLVDQRGTFVLHITFDEKIVEVGTKPLGEFYLDVDVDSHRMVIGTIQSHASKFYRVERIIKQTGSNVLMAEKQVIFEGGVDPDTLTIRESIPIERMSDYVITVVDPVTKQTLPTSVLAFHKHALFVKEIKNSDVRLHVTVQRQPSVATQSSNANNLLVGAAFPIRRADPNAAFHCPFRSGWTSFRIHHSTSGTWLKSPPDSSYETTPQATSTADTISKLSEACFCLDVDLPLMKARLVPAGASHPPDSALFIVYEESFDGKLRSTPCQMSQAFKIRHWCKYTVKCVEESTLTPLLAFCVTDKEVTDIRPCSSTVRLEKRLSQI